MSLFGLTRIPRSYLDVLAAIAEERELHLFVLHPSPSLWKTVVHELDTGPPITNRREDRTAAVPANRLLASWGRDVRELQLVLASAGASIDHHYELPAVETHTLLTAIQQDIRGDRQPPGPPLPGELDGRPALDPADRSVQIHACHGRARQVEVLRDVVLHLLEDDPTLEPRDVIVMCPDIETFAPLIQATFGSGRHADDEDDDDPDNADKRLPDLRVRLADRSLRQTNPVLGVVSQLLALADQRATASQLLDLAGREPVRRRFGFDDDDLSRMQEWVAESGIRWGFDAAHREPFKLGSLQANTWRRGLDRMLVGVAMTEEDSRLVQGVLPLDDVDSGAIDLAGRFAEFVDRVKAAADALTEPQPVAALDRRDRAGRRLADRHQRTRVLAAARAAAPARRCRHGVGPIRRRRGGGRGARARRRPGAARRPAPWAPDARELPHRPPDRLHARADALGPAPGRLHPRARRRRVSRAAPAATATTCSSPSPRSATATRAPRTARCSSTR